MRKWLDRSIAFLALAYPVALLVIVLLFRFRGELWWVTGVGLYLPRIGFVLPLLPIVILLLAFRLYKLLWSQAVAVFILVFPLMGFVMSWPPSARPGEPVLRILSFNIDSANFGSEKIDEQIQKYAPDIVVLQEVELGGVKLPELLQAHYDTVVVSGQFTIGSRFPILEITNPDRILHYGWQRTARFIRYMIETNLGPIALYNVHPISPRGPFYELRGRGLTREILSGHVFSGDIAPDLRDNNALRAGQLQAAAQFASQETLPLIIAGDTNLPGLSHTFASFLSDFQDGFAKAGFGFGYTFHASRRWMRLDRIMANDKLQFLSFAVGCEGASDHLCVVADLQLRER